MNIGGERCPIVDTWWQTETGAILITPLPGITRTKPGSATQPFPGISAEILNQEGKDVPVGGGLLALTRPWPSMLRGIYGDPERYVQQYWSRWSKDIYFTGDGAKLDAQFADLLGALLAAAAGDQDLQAASRELQDFVEKDIVAGWPLPEVWQGDLEIWAADGAPEASGPVLCWRSAGTAACRDNRDVPPEPPPPPLRD